MIHFTDLESLVNIVTGRQLRLTRFDEMFWAGDEGKIIFQCLEDAVQTIDEKDISSEKMQKLKALVENKKTKEGAPVINHFFSDTGTYEEAIPYVICFTTNITGTLSQWLRD